MANLHLSDIKLLIHLSANANVNKDNTLEVVGMNLYRGHTTNICFEILLCVLFEKCSCICIFNNGIF